MAEEAVQEQSDSAEENARVSEQEKRPNAFAFSSILLGGWAALMIVFTLIAVVAMSIVGMVAG